jgi:serine phosphatase RsbU (regulator of sigma subunit)
MIDSINYAKNIQSAILPNAENLSLLFSNSFILFKPKDIVSGDFYWYTSINDKKIVAAVDCTGHGVPGALMSVIGNLFLNEIVNIQGITKPSLILENLKKMVIDTWRQSLEGTKNLDGMDIALVAIDSNKKILEYAGANNPLWITRIENNSKTFIEIKPDKMPIGNYFNTSLTFTNHSIELKDDDIIYISSDGFQDQFGGERKKRLMSKGMKQMVLELNDVNMKKNGVELEQQFDAWKGDLNQIDDVLVIGIKIESTNSLS